jgi:hypothetical protein
LKEETKNDNNYSLLDVDFKLETIV